MTARHLTTLTAAAVLTAGWLAVCVLAGRLLGVGLARAAQLIEEARCG